MALFVYKKLQTKVNLWGLRAMQGQGGKMSNKKMLNMMPMNLQFFAEGDGGSQGGDAGAGAGTGETGAGEGAAGAAGAEIGKSFEDVLKDPKMQSEFDKRVAKALETSRAKMETEIAEKIAAAKTEAEKLAKMNAEQKAQYEQQKRETELAAREAEITKRELSATAKETLAEKGLPIQLADILNYSSAEDCKTSIEAVEKAFTEAVQKSVDEKLKGGNPIKKAPATGKVFTKEELAKMTPEEINQNWDAVQASMKGL